MKYVRDARTSARGERFGGSCSVIWPFEGDECAKRGGGRYERREVRSANVGKRWS